jgi:hypothetical protein
MTIYKKSKCIIAISILGKRNGAAKYKRQRFQYLTSYLRNAEYFESLASSTFITALDLYKAYSIKTMPKMKFVINRGDYKILSRIIFFSDFIFVFITI